MNHKRQLELAQQFRELHHSSRILIMPNVWDVASAKLVEGCGFPAIATASAAVALSRGYSDGESIPLSELLAFVRSLTERCNVPVTVDFERGYGATIAELQDSISQVIDAGAVGINLEDALDESRTLRELDEQCERIKTVKAVAMNRGIPLFVNARTDAFLAITDSEERRREGVLRCQAFEAAGADSLYPLLCSLTDLAEVSAQTTLPINMLLANDIRPIAQLKEAGVSRLTIGPKMFYRAMTEMQSCLHQLSHGEAQDLLDPHNLVSSDVRRILGVG